MSDPRDLEGEMRILSLDRGTADRLLSGVMAPDDAPPGYADVAGLLRACARLSPPDRARERVTIVAMAERIRSRHPATPPAIGRVAARRPARLKIVSVAVGAMVVGMSGLAFAGELPPPAQRIAHKVFGSVGLDVPTPDDETTVEDVLGDSEGPDSSVGSSAGTKGDAISDVATNHSEAGGAHGAAVSSEASNGHGQSDQPHGQPGQPLGQSDQPHGQSDEPHGQSREPHGQPDAEHPR
jgi:hypothetical protein